MASEKNKKQNPLDFVLAASIRPQPKNDHFGLLDLIFFVNKRLQQTRCVGMSQNPASRSLHQNDWDSWIKKNRSIIIYVVIGIDPIPASQQIRSILSYPFLHIPSISP